MSQPPAADPARPEQDPDASAAVREVQYEHTLNWAPILSHLKASILVSTYQAGKVVVVGLHEGALALLFHNFEQVMGMAARPGRIAIGARTHVWFLRSNPELAPRLAPPGRYDACYLTRSAHHTGNIQIHEMAWSGEELWIVNTLFSCLCTLHDEYSFVPRWRPPFISGLASEDRCHLNGFILVNGQPKYVTTLGETDKPQGWRPGKVGGGCLIDVPSGSIIARGFAMPHSPRLHQGQLFMLDSGKGQVVTVDLASGRIVPVVELPGYTRGMALHGQFAFVGLSKIRETSTFGGVPIAENRDRLKCGVAVVELTSGKQVGLLEFKSGVEEIFDIQVLPGIRLPALSGPFAHIDGGEPVWVVPDPRAGAVPAAHPR